MFVHALAFNAFGAAKEATPPSPAKKRLRTLIHYTYYFDSTFDMVLVASNILLFFSSSSFGC